MKPDTIWSISTADTDPAIEELEFRKLPCGCIERPIEGTDVLTHTVMWVVDPLSRCEQHRETT